MRLFRRIWSDIRRGENIDLYVAVPLAIGLAIFSMFGVAPSNLITPITLIILSLIATALLGNRHVVKELSEKLSPSTNTLFLKDLPPIFEDDFEKATEMWMVGVSLTTIIRIHYSIMERKLRKGYKLKALLVHPDGPAIEMAEMRAYGRINVERAKNEIVHSLEDLCELKRIAPNNLEIRTIEHPLGHGLVAIEPETSSGKLYIQNYPFKTPAGSRPKFIIEASDSSWYDFYKQEFYNLWEHGVEWQCDTNNAKQG
jgi:hypothetical protein